MERQHDLEICSLVDPVYISFFRSFSIKISGDPEAEEEADDREVFAVLIRGILLKFDVTFVLNGANAESIRLGLGPVDFLAVFMLLE